MTESAVVANEMTGHEAPGCRGIRVEEPDRLPTALRQGLAGTRGPTVVDAVVTCDPAKMLPAAGSRTVEARQGGRLA